MRPVRKRYTQQQMQRVLAAHEYSKWTVVAHSCKVSEAAPVRRALATINNAALRTLNATPVSVVPAPGSGLYNEVISIHAYYVYATAAFDAGDLVFDVDVLAEECFEFFEENGQGRHRLYLGQVNVPWYATGADRSGNGGAGGEMAFRHHRSVTPASRYY